MGFGLSGNYCILCRVIILFHTKICPEFVMHWRCNVHYLFRLSGSLHASTKRAVNFCHLKILCNKHKEKCRQHFFYSWNRENWWRLTHLSCPVFFCCLGWKDLWYKFLFLCLKEMIMRWKEVAGKIDFFSPPSLFSPWFCFYENFQGKTEIKTFIPISTGVFVYTYCFTDSSLTC